MTVPTDVTDAPPPMPVGDTPPPEPAPSRGWKRPLPRATPRTTETVSAPGGDKPPRVPRTVKAPVTDTVLKKALVELYSAGGMMMLPFDQPCGTAVINSADPCADALVRLSNENPAVRKALTALTQTSAWGGVIAAHMPIIMAVTAHHFGDSVPNLNVVQMNERRPESSVPRPTSRATGREPDGFQRFCPACTAPLVKGVVHECTTPVEMPAE